MNFSNLDKNKIPEELKSHIIDYEKSRSLGNRPDTIKLFLNIILQAIDKNESWFAENIACFKGEGKSITQRFANLDKNFLNIVKSLKEKKQELKNLNELKKHLLGLKEIIKLQAELLAAMQANFQLAFKMGESLGLGCAILGISLVCQWAESVVGLRLPFHPLGYFIVGGFFAYQTRHFYSSWQSLQDALKTFSQKSSNSSEQRSKLDEQWMRKEELQLANLLRPLKTSIEETCRTENSGSQFN
jgi:hypothetical protein